MIVKTSSINGCVVSGFNDANNLTAKVTYNECLEKVDESTALYATIRSRHRALVRVYV